MLQKRKNAKNAKTAKKEGKGNKDNLKVWPLYLMIAVALILYVVLQRIRVLAIVLGVVIFFLIIIAIVLEVIGGGNDIGYKKSIAEIVVAVVAVILFWYGLQFFLGTSSPIDVVPSCSMLPYLHRGDMIFLHGVSSVSQIKAPVVDVTSSQMAKMLSSPNSESLSCIAYRTNSTGTYIRQTLAPGYTVGLIEDINGVYRLVSRSEQQSNLVQYSCETKEVRLSSGQILNEAYTTSITINNKTITGDRNNSIIVYSTKPGDLFYSEGDSYIVHRAYAVLNDSGNYYILTKGDNNPGLDIQYGNYPPNMTDVAGKVIGAVPYLGYLKLIISGDLVVPQGCNSTVLH
jgi:signal peptidase I